MIPIRNQARRLTILVLILCLAGAKVVFAQSSADIMHRSHGVEVQDALLNAFGESLKSVKIGDWAAVNESILEIDDHVSQFKTNFNIDLKPKLTKAIQTKKSGHLLKVLAQVIYLGMKSEFKVMNESQVKDYFDSKVRFDRAKDYYMKILSGNIKRKDASRHERIEAQFLQAEVALGNPGINMNLPSAPPNLKGLEAATEAIDREVLAVYRYFKN